MERINLVDYSSLVLSTDALFSLHNYPDHDVPTSTHLVISSYAMVGFILVTCIIGCSSPLQHMCGRDMILLLNLELYKYVFDLTTQRASATLFCLGSICRLFSLLFGRDLSTTIKMMSR